VSKGFILLLLMMIMMVMMTMMIMFETLFYLIIDQGVGGVDHEQQGSAALRARVLHQQGYSLTPEPLLSNTMTVSLEHHDGNSLTGERGRGDDPDTQEEMGATEREIRAACTGGGCGIPFRRHGESK
jgi:hypothetical protein